VLIILFSGNKKYSFHCSKRKVRTCNNCILRFHCYTEKSGKKRLKDLPEGILDPWVDIVLRYEDNTETEKLIKTLKKRAEFWHRWK